MRRKLGFWRIASLVLLLLAAIGLYIALTPRGGVSRTVDHIARISISGIIQDDRELLERLDKIAKDDRVKALVVSISSPGGTTYGGEVLYKAIRKVADKKPVVSNVRTLAASAGYMIAIAGDTIIAGESSITGSIGVIFQYPQIGELLKKLGVSMEEIKSAPLKAEPSPFHPASEEAKAVIQTMINDSYDWFVGLVAERRKLSPEVARRLADGRIFTGRQALAEKLVDELGGEDEVRAFLVSRKLSPDLPIVDWEAPVQGLPFGLRMLALEAAKILGYDAFPSPLGLEKIGGDKLFLDGLVSVWQVDPS